MPGEAWGDKERRGHEANVVKFLADKDYRKTRGVKTRTAKIEGDEDHIASFDVLCAFFNVLLVWTQAGLDYFFCDGPLPMGEIPRSLFVTIDWQQTQWRAMWFLRHYCRLSLEPILDITHRRAT